MSGLIGVATINHLVQRLLALLDINLTLTEEFTLIRRRSRSRSKSRSKSRSRRDSRASGRSRSRSRVSGRRKKGRARFASQLEPSDDDDDDEDNDDAENGGEYIRGTGGDSDIDMDGEEADGPDDDARAGGDSGHNGEEDEPGEEEYTETTFYRAKLYQDSIMPEVAVLAAWVMVMKMVYGLDEEQRYVLVALSTSQSHPAHARKMYSHVDGQG